MELQITPFVIRLTRPFAIAAGTRSVTDAVLVEVRHEGVTGYGEASLPPYLPGTTDSVTRFLSKVDLPESLDETGLKLFLDGISTPLPGDRPAKAAIDIALHDFVGKAGGFRWCDRWRFDSSAIAPTSFTIGMGSSEEIRESLAGAVSFSVLKVKLGGEHDRKIIETIRGMTDKPLRVDVNQGWADRDIAAGEIEWLARNNVELVEQPMDSRKKDDLLWLRERSPLPIIADEAVATTQDLGEAVGLYDGVNVKLMKCGGMGPARSMMMTARNLGLKVMLGCMTETSCAISAAAQLAPLADWLDLDGALLISNDPFLGARIERGRLVLPSSPGNGVGKRKEFRPPTGD